MAWVPKCPEVFRGLQRKEIMDGGTFMVRNSLWTRRWNAGWGPSPSTIRGFCFPQKNGVPNYIEKKICIDTQYTYLLTWPNWPYSLGRSTHLCVKSSIDMMAMCIYVCIQVSDDEKPGWFFLIFGWQAVCWYKLVQTTGSNGSRAMED